MAQLPSEPTLMGSYAPAPWAGLPGYSRNVQGVIGFSVKGAPVCQGSKTAFVRGGRAVLVDVADRKTKTMPANRLKNWRGRIAERAHLAMREDGVRIGPVHLWSGAVMLECEFIFPRHDSHFTEVSKRLTKSAPMIPVGDLDKLLRAVGDALTKVVYRDDVQVVSFGGSTKRFSQTAAGIGGVKVKVSRL